ncbi:MAG: hypothetical protein WDW36_007921 [Sanguina aurantia]
MLACPPSQDNTKHAHHSPSARHRSPNAQARGVALHKKVPSAKTFQSSISGGLTDVFAGFPRRARPSSAHAGRRPPGMFEARSCPPSADSAATRRRASHSEASGLASTDKHHHHLTGPMALVEFIKRQFVPHATSPTDPTQTRTRRSQHSSGAASPQGASRTASPVRSWHEGEGRRDSHPAVEKGSGGLGWFSRVSLKAPRKSQEAGGVSSPRSTSGAQTPALPASLAGAMQQQQQQQQQRLSRQPSPQQLERGLSPSPSQDLAAALGAEGVVPAGTVLGGSCGAHCSALPQVAR